MWWQSALPAARWTCTSGARPLLLAGPAAAPMKRRWRCTLGAATALPCHPLYSLSARICTTKYCESTHLGSQSLPLPIASAPCCAPLLRCLQATQVRHQVLRVAHPPARHQQPRGGEEAGGRAAAGGWYRRGRARPRAAARAGLQRRTAAARTQPHVPSLVPVPLPACRHRPGPSHGSCWRPTAARGVGNSYAGAVRSGSQGPVQGGTLPASGSRPAGTWRAAPPVDACRPGCCSQRSLSQAGARARRQSSSRRRSGGARSGAMPRAAAAAATSSGRAAGRRGTRAGWSARAGARQTLQYLLQASAGFVASAAHCSRRWPACALTSPATAICCAAPQRARQVGPAGG